LKTLRKNIIERGFAEGWIKTAATFTKEQVNSRSNWFWAS
jgi:hypothetical protein